MFGREGRCSAPSCPALTSRGDPQHGQGLLFYCAYGHLALGDFGNNLPGVFSKNEGVLLHLPNAFGNPAATVRLGFLPCWYQLAGHWCKSTLRGCSALPDAAAMGTSHCKAAAKGHQTFKSLSSKKSPGKRCPSSPSPLLLSWGSRAVPGGAEPAVPSTDGREGELEGSPELQPCLPRAQALPWQGLCVQPSPWPHGRAGRWWLRHAAGWHRTGSGDACPGLACLTRAPALGLGVSVAPGQRGGKQECWDGYGAPGPELDPSEPWERAPCPQGQEMLLWGSQAGFSPGAGSPGEGRDPAGPQQNTQTPISG